eukprot:766488-Hanusia_phi.AAC.3
MKIDRSISKRDRSPGLERSRRPGLRAPGPAGRGPDEMRVSVEREERRDLQIALSRLIIESHSCQTSTH